MLEFSACLLAASFGAALCQQALAWLECRRYKRAMKGAIPVSPKIAARCFLGLGSFAKEEEKG